MPLQSQYQNVFRLSKPGGQSITSTSNNGHQPRVTKRQRETLSCLNCRSKKLKCDRQSPCKSCVERGEETLCKYANSNRDTQKRQNNISASSEAQTRLQKLEAMVTELIRTGKQGVSGSSLPHGYIEDQELANGHLEVKGSETGYHGVTHWATILDNIYEIQHVLNPIDDVETFAPPSPSQPDLLLSTSQPLTVMDITNSMPPKPTCDRLISLYFNAKDTHLPITHSTKFMREYDSFWGDPASVSLLWVSMLSSALHIASQDSRQGNQSTTLSGNTRVSPFLAMASQALIAGQYQKGKPYAPEALLMYGICKFHEKEDSDTDAWTIIGVAVRVAVRMGYHRDPRHFPEIFPFEGEMRRRAFSLASTFDVMLSFQGGLPAIIHEELPPSLRAKPLKSSIINGPHQVIQRLHVDLLYQESLCVLYRKYLNHDKANPEFDYARKTCTDAALEILRYQGELFFACEPGGQFHEESWMLSSLTLHGFLLAAMIVALSLYEDQKQSSSGIGADLMEQSRKYDALKLSYEIWESRKPISKDARHASIVLGTMLRKVHRPLPVSSIKSPTTRLDLTLDTTGIALDSMVSSGPSPAATISSRGFPSTDHSSSDFNLKPLSAMFGEIGNLDWGLIDQSVFSEYDFGGSPVDYNAMQTSLAEFPEF